MNREHGMPVDYMTRSRRFKYKQPMNRDRALVQLERGRRCKRCVRRKTELIIVLRNQGLQKSKQNKINTLHNSNQEKPRLSTVCALIAR